MRSKNVVVILALGPTGWAPTTRRVDDDATSQNWGAAQQACDISVLGMQNRWSGGAFCTKLFIERMKDVYNFCTEPVTAKVAFSYRP